MNNSERGIALIFNFENFSDDPENEVKRIGSEIDRESLIKTFEYLNFRVESFKDLTKKSLRAVIDTFSSREFTDDDCFVCVIMSHGIEDSIVTSDNEDFKLDDLFDPFSKNETLNGKPKLFFIQACRGYGYLTVNSSGQVIRNKSRQLSLFSFSHFFQRVEPDCLYFYSSLYGEVSIRNAKTGSVFIQSLCENLKKFGRNDPLHYILMESTSTVANRNFNVETKGELVPIKIHFACHHALTADIIFLEKTKKL